MYMLMAEERNLPESRHDMHVEILNELGNSWFALLPNMHKVSLPPKREMNGLSQLLADNIMVSPCVIEQELRAKFLKLVEEMEKKGDLVLPFRCAQTIATIDLSHSFQGTLVADRRI